MVAEFIRFVSLILVRIDSGKVNLMVGYLRYMSLRDSWIRLVNCEDRGVRNINKRSTNPVVRRVFIRRVAVPGNWAGHFRTVICFFLEISHRRPYTDFHDSFPCLSFGRILCHRHLYSCLGVTPFHDFTRSIINV